jgi:hypothetical protein
LLAQWLVSQGQLVLDLVIDASGDTDPARVGQSFQARRYVHAVAEEIVALHHDIADVDPNAELHAQGLGSTGLTRGQVPLDLHGTTHGFHGAGKLGDHAIASTAEHPASVLGDQRVDDCTVRAQGAKSALLICAHEARVARDIGAENGSKLAFGALGFHTIIL